MREKGIVRWFNNRKGFGFIARDTGDDVFVHYRNIRSDGFKTLLPDQKVEFNLVSGPKGLQAEDVVVVAD